MKAIVLALLAACTSDPDPHEIVSCSQGSAMMCERVCVAPPRSYDTCMVGIDKCVAFKFDGVYGCCWDGSDGSIVFTDCQGPVDCPNGPCP